MMSIRLIPQWLRYGDSFKESDRDEAPSLQRNKV